jgi:nitrogen regulatory protein P-II 2
MKNVEAIITSFKFDEVRQALSSIGVQELTVSEVRGFSDLYQDSEHEVFLPKVTLDITVPDELVPQVLKTIERVRRTGRTRN